MSVHLAMLLSDWLIWILFSGLIGSLFWIRNFPPLYEPWKQVLENPFGMIALVILLFYVAIGLLDSIHLNVVNSVEANGVANTEFVSVFDLLIRPLGKNDEKTYSAPFATHLYNKTVITAANGQEMRIYPSLQFGGIGLANPEDRSTQITSIILKNSFWGVVTLLPLFFLLIWNLARIKKTKIGIIFKRILTARTAIAWREALITFGIIWILIWILARLALHYHILGTDKIGRDVFYLAIKSIRTGLLIGTLTTLFMLPFALILGTIAGYYGGWVDDVVQYFYTSLSSIPGVLLISAAVLMLQVYISNHSYLFPTIVQRADARLLALCLILGITSWANLCRFLRAETLKLREQEFVQIAKTLGVKKPKIILRHVVPNIMHILLITTVLDFSGLVLAEAILSYVGVGVDPTTISWGNMINSSRLELAREPVVWWPLLAALIFMFFLVLAANIFSDAVRDAFDPRLRKLKEEVI